MKVIAAYLLAVLGGNAQPSAHDLMSIVESVGVSANEEVFLKFLREVEGKDITKLVAYGREKLASVPSVGGAPMAMAASVGGGAEAAAPSVAEPKKEEKVEEKEESDEDMGFSLFD